MLRYKKALGLYSNLYPLSLLSRMINPVGFENIMRQIKTSKEKYVEIAYSLHA